MTNHYLLLAAGAFALAACTSEEVINDVVASRNAIKFENVVNKPSRAAVDINSTNLTQFNVFGFYTMPDEPKHAHEVFNNVPVTKDKGVWGYEKKYERFWVPDATYYFYAYSCGSSELKEGKGKFIVEMEAGDVLASERTLEIKDYICDNLHQHDLLFASKSIEKPGLNSAPVAFQFDHILSKLQARFTNTFQGEYDVVIKRVTIDEICNTGDYSFYTGWQDVIRKDGDKPFVYLLNAYGTEATDESITVVSSNNPKGDSDKMLGESKTAYVIPNDYTSQSAERVYLNITIDVMYGADTVIKEKTLRATLNPKWEPGCTYIYNVELNAANINLNKIDFTVDTITDWDTKDKVTDSNASLDKETTD